MEWIKRDFSNDITIFDGLREHEASDKVAVICGEQSVSYRELIGKSKLLARGLLSYGVKKGIM
jgi:non-ribosomal peptide synthetase component E (peptide arylation enzyme)